MWDKGVNLETIISLIKRLRRKYAGRKYACYLDILYVQALNGLRISEAVDAYIEYIKTRNSVLDVTVRKKKKPDKRRVFIRSIDTEGCEWVLLTDKDKLVARAKVVCRRLLGINTHTIRYAYITYLASMGVESSIIAKITHHTKLDMVLRYTQTKRAEEIQKAVFESLASG